MADDVWILGIHMTKFGKHPDKDVVDLGAEAARAALKDGGVTMKDMGVMAAGNLMGRGGVAQDLQKQVEEAWICFLKLIEQQDAERLLTDTGREEALACSRERPSDQPLHCCRIVELVQVKSRQARCVSKKEFGRCLRQLRLTGARRANEQE